jgi:hypothetical protein
MSAWPPRMMLFKSFGAPGMMRLRLGFQGMELVVRVDGRPNAMTI